MFCYYNKQSLSALQVPSFLGVRHKYTGFRPCGFREDCFLCFSYYKSMADNDSPLGVTYVVPRGMVGRIAKIATHKI